MQKMIFNEDLSFGKMILGMGRGFNMFLMKNEKCCLIHSMIKVTLLSMVYNMPCC